MVCLDGFPDKEKKTPMNKYLYVQIQPRSSDKGLSSEESGQLAGRDKRIKEQGVSASGRLWRSLHQGRARSGLRAGCRIHQPVLAATRGRAPSTQAQLEAGGGLPGRAPEVM